MTRPTFEMAFTAGPEHIDELGHVNNAVWVQWIQQVAVAHWEAVADAALQLQANWMTDYRNGSGIVIEDGPAGPALTIEDSSRVDPWIVRQAQRVDAECTERLAEFSRRDSPTGD